MDTQEFIPYARQSINTSDKKAVAAACEAPWITRGPQVQQFEESIAEYCGAKYGVAFSSGTAALHAAAFAVEAGPLDRTLVPAITFVASAAAQGRGAQVQLLDIDPSTGNISLEALSEVMQQRHSRGRMVLVPVHFAGVPVDMAALQETILDPNAVVIEDAAHAIGSRYSDGERVGSCCNSDITTLSFHPAKTMTCGEGGMATTNDSALADRLRLFRDNGIERDAAWHYQVKTMTGNFHMTEMQAALGLSQLKRLDTFVARRLELMGRYAALLEGLEGVNLLSGAPQSNVAYHLCALQIDFTRFAIDREELMTQLKEKGIGTQIHYIPLYRHPLFSGHPSLPECENYYERALTLPLYPDLSDGDVERICATLKDLLQKN